MSRSRRADYLGLVEIQLPRWVARLCSWPRRAYLQVLINAAEQDVQRHEWHAQQEPKLAQAARDRAAELRVELATINTKGTK